MKITLDQLVQNLAESRLMPADRTQALLRSIPDDKRPRDAETFARILVKNKKLTAYQGKAVLRGVTKGLVLGDYVVLDELGRGGMGFVLKARDRRMDRDVAIKRLHGEALKSKDAVQRFFREGKAAARLLHPNIVAAFHAAEQDGIHYLVMEYVEGRDLSSMIEAEGPLPIERAVDYVIQAATGLAYAHDEGVVHRDVKPSNLLLDKRGRIKVLDMGLALIGKSQDGKNMPGGDQLTGSGQVMGTCDYMAPEQAEDTHKAGPPADIYALGCTLYRLVTGEPPYQGDTLVNVLIAHREAEIPSLTAKRPDVPPPLDAISRCMMAKRPEQRYGAMGEVIATLESLRDGDSPRAPGAAQTDSSLTDFLERFHDDSPSVSANDSQGRPSKPAKAAVAPKPATAPVSAPSTHSMADSDTAVHLRSTSGRPEPASDRPRRATQNRRQRQEWMFIAVGVLLGFCVVAAAVVGVMSWGRDDNLAEVTVVPESDSPSPPAKSPPDARQPEIATFDVDPAAPEPAIAPFDADKAKAYQREWAVHLGLPVERDFDLPGGEKLMMRLIPPGDFLMGATDEEQARFWEEAKAAKDPGAIDRIPSEGPQHRVRITQPFYLGKYEVTQAQWDSVTGNHPSNFKDNPSHPVEQVSWDDIQPFLDKLNAAGTLRLPAGKSTLAGQRLEFALPTEAQWEYACRVGTTTFWHDGDTEEFLRASGWYKENSGSKTHPVGQLKASVWGLYDMHGNVLEWCADRYGKDYYGQSPTNDPSGPLTGSHRVTRGGSWNRHAMHCRSAYRDYCWPDYRSNYLGLRLACTIPYTPGTKPAVPAPPSSNPPAELPAPPDGPPPATAPGDADQAKPGEQAAAEEDSVDGVRTWTDASGKAVEAAFVEFKDGPVRLRLPDGKIASVALERLSEQDQAYVSERAESSVSP